MPAKVPAKPAANTAAEPGSPCSQRGAEIVAAVFANRDQRVQAFSLVCSTPARMRIAITSISSTGHGGTVLFDQGVPPPNPVLLDLSPLPAGEYIVQWSYIATGPEWEVVAEIIVDGVTRFRKRNSAGDSLPATTIWAFLAVR